VPAWYLVVHLFWIPAIALVFRFAYTARWPVRAAALSYFFGCVSVVPAFLIESVWNVYVPESRITNVLELPLWACPVEEWAKLLAALLTARLLNLAPHRRSFIALAISASLGFAAAETLLFVMERGAEILPLRVLISMPAHVSFTMFAAVGLAGSRTREVTRRTFWGWWFLSSVAHTAFSAPLVFDPDVSPFLPILLMAAFLTGAGLLATVRLRRRRLVD